MNVINQSSNLSWLGMDDFRAVELKTARTDNADILACASWHAEKKHFRIALVRVE